MTVALILLAIGTGFVFWNRINARLCRDGFSPLHIMFFSWVFPLSLRGLHLSGTEEEWSRRTILMLLYITIALAVVSVIGARIARKYPFPSRRAIFGRTLRRFHDGMLVWFLLMTWAVVFVVYVYVEFVTNPAGMPVLARLRGVEFVSDAHRWGKDTRWAAITSLLFVLTPMLYLAFRSARNRAMKWLLLTVVLLYPIAGFLKLSRSDIFIATLNIAAMELYYRKFRSLSFRIPKLSPMKWTMLAVVVVTLFAGTLYLRTSRRSHEFRYSTAIEFRWQGGVAVEALSQMYGYLALPFENFHRYFSREEGGFRPGVSFFRPLLSAIGKGDIADRMLEDVDFRTLSGASGSHTFLPHLYAELGTPGLIVIPVVYAIFMNVLYVRFRKRPTTTNLFLYLNFLFPWAWLFFNNAFSVLSFYINAAFVLFVALLSLVTHTPRRVLRPVRNRVSAGGRARSESTLVV